MRFSDDSFDFSNCFPNFFFITMLPPIISRLNNPLFPGFRDCLGDGDVG
jgi:hypothetical protein